MVLKGKGKTQGKETTDRKPRPFAAEAGAAGLCELVERVCRAQPAEIFLEGIRRLAPRRPKDFPQRKLSKAEIDEEFQKEYHTYEAALAECSAELMLISARLLLLTEFYDKHLLGGYSEENAEKYKIKECIPCFVSLPVDYSMPIQLLYAIRHANMPNGLDFEEICRRALELEGEEKMVFLYELRRNLVEHVKRAEWMFNNPWMKIDLRQFDVEDESSWEISGFKVDALRCMGPLSDMYQLAVFLVENKLEKEG